LSEEARKRPGGEQSTIAARQAETVDLNEETKKWSRKLAKRQGCRKRSVYLVK
jgi:hypothetical protein